MMGEQKKGWGTRTLKAYISAAVLFGGLTLLMGALLRFTSLPDTGTSLYILVILCAACLFIGIYSGSISRQKGFLFGLIYSAGFLILVLFVAFAAIGFPPEVSILKPRFLLCLLCGSIGGIFGVNLRI